MYDGKDKKYNELEFAIDHTELRMESYLKIFGLYCDKDNNDAVFQLFVGAKCLATSVVRFKFPGFSLT